MPIRQKCKPKTDGVRPERRTAVNRRIQSESPGARRRQVSPDNSWKRDHIPEPVNGRIVQPDETVRDLEAQVGHVKEKAKLFEEETKLQLLREQARVAQQMEVMKHHLATENMNIQMQAQQLVLAETQKVAAAEHAAQVRNNEGKSELAAARLEADSLRTHANRLAEMAQSAVSDSSAGRAELVEVAARLGQFSTGMTQAAEHCEAAKSFSEATADHAYSEAIRRTGSIVEQATEQQKHAFNQQLELVARQFANRENESAQRAASHEEACQREIVRSHELVAEAFAARDAEQRSLHAELHEFQRRATEREQHLHASIQALSQSKVADNGAGVTNGGFSNRDREFETPSPVDRELSSPSPFNGESPPPAAAPDDDPPGIITSGKRNRPLCFNFVNYGKLGCNGDECPYVHARISQEKGPARILNVEPKTRRTLNRTGSSAQRARSEAPPQRSTHEASSSSRAATHRGGAADDGSDDDDPGDRRGRVDDRRDGEPANKPKPKVKAKAKAKAKARARSEPPKRCVRFNVSDAEDESQMPMNNLPAIAVAAPAIKTVTSRAAQILERNERLRVTSLQQSAARAGQLKEVDNVILAGGREARTKGRRTTSRSRSATRNRASARGYIEGGDDNPGSSSSAAVSDIFSEPYDANEKTSRKPGDPYDDEDDDWCGEGEEDPEEEENVEVSDISENEREDPRLESSGDVINRLSAVHRNMREAGEKSWDERTMRVVSEVIKTSFGSLAEVISAAKSSEKGAK